MKNREVIKKSIYEIKNGFSVQDIHSRLSEKMIPVTKEEISTVIRELIDLDFVMRVSLWRYRVKD